MGNSTFKMKSYLSGSNTDTSLTHIYSSNYSTSLYILHETSFCHKKQCSPSQEKSCVVVPTTFCTLILQFSTIWVHPWLLHCKIWETKALPTLPHWKCEDDNRRQLISLCFPKQDKISSFLQPLSVYRSAKSEGAHIQPCDATHQVTVLPHSAAFHSWYWLSSGIPIQNTAKTQVFWILCCVCHLISLSSRLFLWISICELVQVLFLSL
jgi:hypothetical protein